MRGPGCHGSVFVCLNVAMATSQGKGYKTQSINRRRDVGDLNGLDLTPKGTSLMTSLRRTLRDVTVMVGVLLGLSKCVTSQHDTHSTHSVCDVDDVTGDVDDDVDNGAEADVEDEHDDVEDELDRLREERGRRKQFHVKKGFRRTLQVKHTPHKSRPKGDGLNSHGHNIERAGLAQHAMTSDMEDGIASHDVMDTEVAQYSNDMGDDGGDVMGNDVMAEDVVTDDVMAYDVIADDLSDVMDVSEHDDADAEGIGGAHFTAGEDIGRVDVVDLEEISYTGGLSGDFLPVWDHTEDLELYSSADYSENSESEEEQEGWNFRIKKSFLY